MKLQHLSTWMSDHVAAVVLAVGIVALAWPASFTWIPTSSVNWLLGVVMFGMGLTLRPNDFATVLVRPLPVLVGCAAQFSIMPLVAWALCKVFALPAEIAVGVILVGCCPGGTASNIITYLAKGDTALSVCMTGISTLCAPFLTPLLTWWLAGETVDVDVWAMMLSVVQVVILPIVLGLLVRWLLPQVLATVVSLLPSLSTMAVAVIIGIVLSANAARVLSCGWLIVWVVVLHNLCGLVLGYGVGRALRLAAPQRHAIAIEVGMQNSGLATSLAASHFAAYPLATIPGAIFSVWHNFSGALAAHLFRRQSA
ncbi:MAG: bile acid:sodium symporter family protein [Bacteroidaceae bacterium]|nr:bile acid:sodium symporter family protein [Bacteroidaceae bacterium]